MAYTLSLLPFMQLDGMPSLLGPSRICMGAGEIWPSTRTIKDMVSFHGMSPKGLPRLNLMSTYFLIMSVSENN